MRTEKYKGWVFYMAFGVSLFLTQFCKAQDLPTTVTTRASSIDGNAELCGIVNPNGSQTTAWFEWGTNILHGNTTPSIALGDGLTNLPISSSLTGLVSGISYHYRVVATNSVGYSYGRDAIFQNLPVIVQPPALVLSGGCLITNAFFSPYVDPEAFVIAPLNTIAAGQYYSLALKVDGTVAAWGNAPAVPIGLSNVTAIAAGYINSLAIKTDGTVVAWGDNDFGETNIPPGLSNIVAVSSGWGFCLGLKCDGTVVGWGLGATDPLTYDGLNFAQANVPTNLCHIVAIAAGFDSSLALKSDGTVVSWGYPQPYEGFPDFAGVAPPNDLSNVVAIATGGDFGLALKSDGTVCGWGYNGEGQTSVPPGLSNVIAVAAGFYHSLALKNDGTVVGWGDDFYGESTSPSGLTNVIAIAAGAYHSLALKSDGTVVGWGFNPYGEMDITTAGTDLITAVPASGEVNVNEAGSYVLTYSATNSLGDMSSLTRTVIVSPPPPPTIAITMSVSNQQSDNPMLSVQSLASGHVEVSTNLITWDTLTNFVGTNSPIIFFDTAATNSKCRFYRIVTP